MLGSLWLRNGLFLTSGLTPENKQKLIPQLPAKQSVKRHVICVFANTNECLQIRMFIMTTRAVSPYATVSLYRFRGLT
jgi:hypothetical protein